MFRQSSKIKIETNFPCQFLLVILSHISHIHNRINCQVQALLRLHLLTHTLLARQHPHIQPSRMTLIPTINVLLFCHILCHILRFYPSFIVAITTTAILLHISLIYPTLKHRFFLFPFSSSLLPPLRSDHQKSTGHQPPIVNSFIYNFVPCV